MFGRGARSWSATSTVKGRRTSILAWFGSTSEFEFDRVKFNSGAFSFSFSFPLFPPSTPFCSIQAGKICFSPVQEGSVLSMRTLSFVRTGFPLGIILSNNGGKTDPMSIANVGEEAAGEFGATVLLGTTNWKSGLPIKFSSNPTSIEFGSLACPSSLIANLPKLRSCWIPLTGVLLPSPPPFCCC